MLKSAGLPLYQHLNVHGYWQIGQAKMGKSVGNVVDALGLADTYGVDAFRYFLARDMVFGLDSEFVEDALVARYNAALANDLGNLWQRSLTMLGKFGGGRLPAPGRLEDEAAWAAHLTEKVLAEYADHFRSLAVHRALAVTWELITALNKFIDTEAPWALAKDPARAERLQGVLYRLIQGLALIGSLIWPVMPKTGQEIWRRLGLETEGLCLDLQAIGRQLIPGRPVAVGEPLFPRVEFGGEKAALKSAAARPAEARPDPVAQPGPPLETITMDEFQRADLRTAEIIAAERVPKSKKLLKFLVRVGQEERTIVSGIAQHYQPEELVGQTVVIVANLAPVKLMGITSQGMILCASRKGEDEILSILTTLAPLPSGLKVS